MSESARSVLKHLYKEGRMTEEQYQKIDRNLKEPQWIPYSERLPKRDELVLVSFKTGGVHLCKYLDDGSENPWWSYKDDCFAWDNTVVAWMPMPTPHKGEGDEK